MTNRESVAGHVYGIEGQIGTIAQNGIDLAISKDQTIIELTDGRHVVIPSSMLSRRQDGSYEIAYSLTELLQEYQAVDNQHVVIPVVAEELEVSKRVVETGRVNVRKLVQEHTEQVDVPVLREEVQVERIAINQLVEQMPAVRHENDVMIIPVVEEVLVVEKRLMLREEVRITKRQTTTSEPQQVTLRREEVIVERLAPRDDAGAQ